MKIAIGLGALVLIALLSWWLKRQEKDDETDADASESGAEPPDEESLDHLRTNARYLVWAGFHNRAEILEILPDVAAVDAAPSLLAPIVDIEIQKKRAAESGWPEKTDCDRLDAAFEELKAHGVFAQQYVGYTQSDGLSDVSEALDQEDAGSYSGFCFYTAQDVEGLLDGATRLWLAFGANNEEGTGAVEVGQKICSVLQAAGFETEWDGTVNTRPAITNIDWKRRS